MAAQTKLCVFCRHIVPITHACATTPTWGMPEPASPLRPHEAAMFRELQSQPSSLCQRCSVYDIARAFRDAIPLDRLEKMERDTAESHHQYFQDMQPFEYPLGRLSSLVLSPSCPLCRLIFRVLPREGLDADDDSARLVPFRSYTQHSGWQKVAAKLRPTGAVLLGIDFLGNSVALSGVARIGSENQMMQSEMPGEAIALTTSNSVSLRKVGNAKYIEPMVDLSFPKHALENCIKNHGSFCQPGRPPELQTTRMIDVVERKVVPYPNGCNYFALSYCWGGVMPKDGALEAGELPQTIEDAIFVTRELGMRYLWVDALCIDQSPNPTPEQAKEKMQQLRMMDLIYSCASLALIAMAGTNSEVGLPGISANRPRDVQLRENIGGLEFITVPPTVNAERNSSIWATRAWTLQEEFLSRRHLIFTGTQMEFQCYRRRIPETLDTSNLDGWPSPLPDILDMIVPGAHEGKGRLQAQLPAGEEHLLSDVFWSVLNEYTRRKMTNDGDSLNAMLGLLNVWERTLLPSGCIWGIPLKDYPESLGWLHRRSVKPRRRAAFPSWSWAGWEGEAYLEDFLAQGSPKSLRDCVKDMSVRYVDIEGQRLTVDGWTVDLDIHTEPFSEVHKPGTTKELGKVIERNFLHPNTLPTGTYSCLVVERLKYRLIEDGPVFEKVFMLVLDWVGNAAERRTIITLTIGDGGNFECLGPVRKMVALV
ncbi:hypothetical protein OQA88_9476 [Cercophora sp. LCS_1]